MKVEKADAQSANRNGDQKSNENLMKRTAKPRDVAFHDLVNSLEAISRTDRCNGGAGAIRIEARLRTGAMRAQLCEFGWILSAAPSEFTQSAFANRLICLFCVLLSFNTTALMAQVPTWGKDQTTTSVGADQTRVGWTDLQNAISDAGFYCPGVVGVVPEGIDKYGYVLKVDCAITRYFRVSVITGYGSVMKTRVGAWPD